MSHRRLRATPRLAVTLAAGLLALSACSSGEDPAAAEAAAAPFAAALSERDLATAPIAGGGQAQFDDIVAAVDDIPATVTVDSVVLDGDTATATLAWQWATPGRPWRYATTAGFSRDEDTWTAQWAPAVVEPSLVAGEALAATLDQPERADILGAGEDALVTLRPVMRLGIDKSKVPAEDAAASARALADLVGIDPQAYAEAVEKAGPKAFVEAIVLREVDAAEIGQAAVEAIPGAVGKADELPLAPTRDFAPEILGRVWPATAEVIEESGGAVLPGEEVGLSRCRSLDIANDVRNATGVRAKRRERP
jgi:hypothetical protein